MVRVISLIAEVIEDQGENFVVFGLLMELSKLGDLHTAILNSTIKTYVNGWSSLVEFLICIASGLNSGHKASRLHCDIKPKNILLFKSDGVVVPKLTDFGISRAILELVPREQFPTR